MKYEAWEEIEILKMKIKDRRKKRNRNIKNEDKE